MRSEIIYSYTPYKPEVSQGMLQAIYEFQTMVCQITGMDIANASLYDGSTALVEAVLMALGPGGRGEIVISTGVDPQYRRVLQTYAFSRGFEIKEVSVHNGVTSLEDLDSAVNTNTSAVIIQPRNVLGCIENVQAVEPIAHRGNALFATAINAPPCLAVVATPGACTVD